jgi:hypothetical protein
MLPGKIKGETCPVCLLQRQVLIRPETSKKQLREITLSKSPPRSKHRLSKKSQPRKNQPEKAMNRIGRCSVLRP